MCVSIIQGFLACRKAVKSAKEVAGEVYGA